MHRRHPAILSTTFLLTVVGTTHAGTGGIFSLADLNGFTGFRAGGFNKVQRVGQSVSSAGDINGDGIDDVAVGTFEYYAEGKTFIVFGRRETFSPINLILSSLDGTDGFRLEGVATDDFAGASIASAGDINGDKITDLIIGAPYADPGADNYAGSSFVVFGRKSTPANPDPFDGSIDLADLDGTNGFRIDGIDVDEISGFRVAGAGDVNGDKINDILIGAPHLTASADKRAGSAYVIYGRKRNNPFPANIDLASLDGTNGFRINGITEDDQFGRAIASAGDMNGDKVADIIIGAPLADPNANSGAGQAYILFGRKLNNPSPAVVNIADLDGTNGLRLDGLDAGDLTGISVASAGDLNGDKIADVIIGAEAANNARGECYVIYGSKLPFPASINLSTLNGTNGFYIAGAADGDRAGTSVASAGDVNADKINDIIIGARDANATGGAFVVFGRNAAANGPFPTSFELSTINGTNGFRLNGVGQSHFTGTSVASAGDINADGRADLIIGAPAADIDGDEGAGSAFIVLGPAPEAQVTFEGIIALSTPALEDASTLDFTELFGPFTLQDEFGFNFEIRNLGLADLSVTKLKAPKGFTIISQPDAAVGPLGSTPFTLQINPTRTGNFTGKVSFTTNDRDEKKFDFTLQWTVGAMLSATDPGRVIDVDSLPDLNNDWGTDTADLILMLHAIHHNDQTSGADLNHDEMLNADDLVILLSGFSNNR